MKLSEYKEDYYFFTGKVSEITRQLGFAGIALIWIFRDDVNGKIIINESLLLPAILIVSALAVDFTHYIVQAITWSLFYQHHKKKVSSEESEVTSSERLNIPSWILFSIKVLLIIIAYILIIIFLINQFSI